MSTNRDREKFVLRMVDGLRDRLKAVAKANHRTMTAEINMRLEKSLEADASKE